MIFSRKKLFEDKDKYEIMRFAYAVNPEGFKDAFMRDIGLSINNEDEASLLISLIKRGGDKKGELRDEKRIKIPFDGESIIRGIKISENQLKKRIKLIVFTD